MSENDPFAPENIGILQYITLARIYDVLFLDLELKNKDAADRLAEIHAQGKLIGPPPDFSGEFLSD